MSQSATPFGERVASSAAATAVVLLGGCNPGSYEIPLDSSPSSSTSAADIASSADPTQASLDSSSGSSHSGTATGSESAGTTTGGECEAGPPADWWDAAWNRRRPLLIDTSIAAGVLENFPVLLRLDVDDLGDTWTERGGADLRFRSEDQRVRLRYDLDDVTPDGELLVWLSIPLLDPARAQTVWMYYDNPDAGTDASPEEVWAGYISVHHLGLDLLDSAGSHHGSSPWEPEVCEGKCEPLIGAARRFIPEQLSEVELALHQDYDFGYDRFDYPSFAITAWMRSTSLADNHWGALVAKGENTWRVHTTDSSFEAQQNLRVAFSIDCYQASCLPQTGSGNLNAIATAPVNDGQWHHVAATFSACASEDGCTLSCSRDLNILRIYIDGQPSAAQELCGYIEQDDAPVRLGVNTGTASRYGGELDEVRIIKYPGGTTISAARIAADHATVTQDHIMVQPEEAICP